MKAFAIAIHIPVLLWAVTGHVIASQIFRLAAWPAAAVACLCAGLIYLVERLVLATPKVWFVNLGRVLIGVVTSVLGASTVDLVIFDREITQQLREAGEARIQANADKAADTQRHAVALKRRIGSSFRKQRTAKPTALSEARSAASARSIANCPAKRRFCDLTTWPLRFNWSNSTGKRCCPWRSGVRRRWPSSKPAEGACLSGGRDLAGGWSKKSSTSIVSMSAFGFNERYGGIPLPSPSGRLRVPRCLNNRPHCGHQVADADDRFRAVNSNFHKSGYAALRVYDPLHT